MNMPQGYEQAQVQGERELPELGFHPCDNTQSLAIGTEDFFEKFLPATGHVPEFVEIHDFMEE